MSCPAPLPRKYLTALETAQADLRLMAQRTRIALDELTEDPRSLPHVSNILREVETLAYRVALDLSELEVKGSCDGCPSAPPTTAVQVHLLVLAEELERQAALARMHVRGEKAAAFPGRNGGGPLDRNGNPPVSGP